MKRDESVRSEEAGRVRTKCGRLRAGKGDLGRALRPDGKKPSRRMLERTAQAVGKGAPDPEAAKGAGSPLALATGAARRGRGLLLARPRDESLLLLPCNDVHTVGMRHRIDVAFVDGAGNVLEAHRDVGSCRRLRHRKAVAVVERFSTCSTPWFSTGDRIGMVRMEGEGL